MRCRGDHLEPALDLVNPQHEKYDGSRCLFHMHIAWFNTSYLLLLSSSFQTGWIHYGSSMDLETGKCKTTIKGHVDCSQSVAVRESNRQSTFNWIRGSNSS